MKYPYRLKEIRNTLGLALQEVALLMGKNCEDKLTEWEGGLRMPSGLNFIRLSEIHGVRVHELYPHKAHENGHYQFKLFAINCKAFLSFSNAIKSDLK